MSSQLPRLSFGLQIAHLIPSFNSEYTSLKVLILLAFDFFFDFYLNCSSSGSEIFYISHLVKKTTFNEQCDQFIASNTH